jgi:capsular polysaccharide export protein
MGGILFYLNNIVAVITNQHFVGWGRKKTGRFAIWCHKTFGGTLMLKEDGFIRSLGLGVDASPSLSIVEDDVGIYYDATMPSKLENILNTYDFSSDMKLMYDAKKAIELIVDNCISKYNHGTEEIPKYILEDETRKVLIVAQTAGDASLVYGMLQDFTTHDMIEAAIKENPDAIIYIKMHPDVLSGKKKSDIDLNEAKERCIIIRQDVNPIALLKHFDKVYTKTSQMGFEALLVGCECVCFGMPFYAGWGITDDRASCERRKRILTVKEVFAAAYILYPRYYNTYANKSSDIFDTIKYITCYREIYRINQDTLYFFGFSVWKWRFTTPFFKTYQKNTIHFCSDLSDGIQKGLRESSKIFIWGKKPFEEVELYAKEKNISIYRVEDGFIRSVSLGSDLTKAYSLVVDSRGIYFDSTHESDLEFLLNTYSFSNEELQRAKTLQHYLVENKISKYNIYAEKELEFKELQKGQTIILVPGQVEDDASIIYGATGMTNLFLLKQTRMNAPDSYIVYKPHPDVLAGNRKGHVEPCVALEYCNSIVTDVSIDSIMIYADEVHTLTSLVGFEALLRGKKVTTYGLPFYAGWGLTTDAKSISRRKRKLTLEELIVATLILYPRYIHPKTNQFCEVEILLGELGKEKKLYNNNLTYRVLVDGRNFISRKAQFILKVILDE